MATRRRSITLATTLVAIAFSAPAARSEVRLPALIGSHMVLQRDRPVRLWGWGSPGEVVRITAGAAGGQATTGQDGRWSIELPPQPAGGPHIVSIAGQSTITLQDVWFGEVWLASGQSNMEWPLAQANGGQEVRRRGLPGIAAVLRGQGHVAAPEG